MDPVSNSPSGLTSPSWDPVKGKVSPGMRSSGLLPVLVTTFTAEDRTGGTPEVLDESRFSRPLPWSSSLKPLLNNKLQFGTPKSDAKGSPILLFERPNYQNY